MASHDTMRAQPEPLREHPLPAGFQGWLNGAIVHVATSQHSDHQWYALAEEFNIAGMGRTEREAIAEMAELVDAYLLTFFHEGRPYEDAVQPISASLKAKILVGTALHTMLRGFADRLPVPQERRCPVVSLDQCAQLSA